MDFSTAVYLPAEFWASAKRRAVRGTEGKGNFTQTETMLIELLSKTVSRFDYPARINDATNKMLEVSRMLKDSDGNTALAQHLRRIAESIDQSALARALEENYTIMTDDEVGEQSLLFGVIVQGRETTLSFLRAQSNREIQSILARRKYFSVK
jgi:hypothetical protein